MQYNNYQIQSREITGDPVVTVAEAKSYMRIEGFQDVDESPSTQFDDDDDLIEQLIESATETLEERYGLAIRNQTVTATITNLCGNIQIPFAPIDQDTFELTNSDDNPITNIKLVGAIYPRLKCPECSDMTAVYDAGFRSAGMTVPKALKTEVLRMVSWMFTNRGESDNLKGFVYSTGQFNQRPWLI